MIKLSRAGKYASETEIYCMSVPDCEFCHSLLGVTKEAKFRFLNAMGNWSDGCTKHWRMWAKYLRLGTNQGQEYVKIGSVQLE